MSECDHGAVTADACHLCRGDQTAVVLGDPRPSRPFHARYDGVCNGCGFDIKAGEPVRYVGERMRLHHTRCTR